MSGNSTGSCPIAITRIRGWVFWELFWVWAKEQQDSGVATWLDNLLGSFEALYEAGHFKEAQAALIEDMAKKWRPKSVGEGPLDAYFRREKE